VPHAAMSANYVAVVTGGASGLGLAAAMRFARLGMKVCIADLGANRLAEAEAKIAANNWAVVDYESRRCG